MTLSVSLWGSCHNSRLQLEENQSQVDAAGRQQFIALDRTEDRQQLIVGLSRLVAEVELVDRGIHVGVGVRALDRDVLQLHRRRRQLRLEHELVGEGTIRAVYGMLLVVVHPRFHHPLVAEGAEATCLVEQLADVVVCAIRPQLQVWKWRVGCQQPLYTQREGK